MSEIVCLIVFASGVCRHPDNGDDKMHVCALPYLHNNGPLEPVHRCACGKDWREARLTEQQYGEIAFTKAVE